MKIDLVITELDVGGAEQCLTNLALHLHGREHRVRMIALGPPPPKDRNRLLGELSASKIETHFLGGKHVWQTPRTLAKMRRLITRSLPDLVQSFLFHGNLMASLAYPRRVPLVGGVRVVEPSRRRSRMNRWAARRMKRVVCVSHSVADACRVRDGIPGHKLVVIPNGINPDRCAFERFANPTSEAILPCSRWAQSQLGLSPTTPCLLFVGRFDHQKGIDVLIDRADRILSALPLHNLVLIGDGPMKIQAQSRASFCRHENRIHFAGRRNDVMEWMQSSQLLLLPTRYEGMPNVVLEAMACGLPVVSTRAEGIVELLGPGIDEQTVPVNDWDAWERRVLYLATESEPRTRLARANFERCVTQFALDDKLLQYENLYRSILT